MAAPHTETQSEEHTSFIKTPQQLVTVIVLAFVVPIAVIVMLAKLALMGSTFDSKHPGMSDEAIAERIKPVGKVLFGEAPAAKGSKSGEEVYKQVCAACHTTGALNAPKLGDKAAWSKLIPQGLGMLTADAIKGIRQMPARGGNPDLSDAEVERAVVYMANQSGANFKEPQAAAAPAAAPAAAAPASGKSIYDASCAACHAAGVAGAPKTGDKAAWAERNKQGADVLYAAVVKGKGAMPPKGGNAALTDADVKAAVDYMVGLAK
jgi:cytochrome c5